MNNRPVIEFIPVAAIPPECKPAIISGATVRIIMQRTGFGQRRYFLCPACGRKCSKLYHINLLEAMLYCQRCTPINLYRYRQNLYDEGGRALITWHMKKLAAAISDEPIKYPFSYLDYPIEPPQGMRSKRYRNTLLKLQVMENMRVATYAYGCRFAGSDIRKYTRDGFICMFELWQVADYLIFGTEIPPEAYALLLDDETAPEIPPGRLRPRRISFNVGLSPSAIAK